MEVELQGERVVKVAGSDAERARLGAEARALRACAHPGVVRLLGSDGGDPPSRLFLARVAGRSLAAAPVGMEEEVVAGVLASVAATLADLHALGWVHGAISAEHLLLDERGRPVLCGFGRSCRPPSRSALTSLAADDVAALIAVMAERLPAHADRRLLRLLSAPSGRRTNRPLNARRLARRAVDLVPGARLESPVGRPEPDPGPPTAGQPLIPPGQSLAPPGQPPPPPGQPATSAGQAVPRAGAGPARRWLVPAGGGVAAAALGVGLVMAGFHPGRGSPRGHAGPGPAAPHVGPAGRVPRPVGAPPAPVGRYVLSDPGGGRLITAVGRWGCGPARPAALDLADGWVWIFGHWPGPGSSLRARAVIDRPGAVGLVAERAGDGCDDLLVLGRGGTRHPVPRTALVSRS